MNIKEIAIGEQSFERMITENSLYVDKTAQIHQFVRRSGTYFLARPRRFGKSLTLSTMQAFFQGKRELFKGLAIDKLEYDWKKYPVLFLSMPGLSHHEDAASLQEKIQDKLLAIAQAHNLTLNRDKIDTMLATTITTLAHNNKKVVVLVDEYDKPLIDIVHDLEKTNPVRSVLKTFYGTFKTSYEHIHFLFITGVAHFAMKYYEKFLKTGKIITLVGLTFDSVRRTVTEYDHENLT